LFESITSRIVVHGVFAITSYFVFDPFLLYTDTFVLFCLMVKILVGEVTSNVATLPFHGRIRISVERVTFGYTTVHGFEVYPQSCVSQVLAFDASVVYSFIAYPWESPLI
jgi:hypothetical protein